MPIRRIFQLWVRRNAVLILGVSLCVFFVLAALAPIAHTDLSDLYDAAMQKAGG